MDNAATVLAAVLEVLPPLRDLRFADAKPQPHWAQARSHRGNGE